MKLKPWKPVDISKISPERIRIAKIFKTHIERAIDDLGPGYDVTVQGRYDKTPIWIKVEITSSKGEMPRYSHSTMSSLRLRLIMQHRLKMNNSTVEQLVLNILEPDFPWREHCGRYIANLTC